MTYAIAELQRQLAKIVTLGLVKTVDAKNGTVTVDLGDNLITPKIPVVQALAGANGTTYVMPAIGEQVLVFAMGGILETAFVVGSVYQDKHPTGQTDARVQMLKGADGATFVYDGQGTLSVSGIGHISIVASSSCNITAPTCVVNANSATLTAPNISLAGNVSVTGDLSVGGDGTFTGATTFNKKARFNKGTVIPKTQKYDVG